MVPYMKQVNRLKN